MDNDIRILIGLTDLNVDFDPKAEQHFNETNLNRTATITWNLFLTYATNCEKCGTPMVHNGTKMVTHKGPRSAFKFQNYRIRKQKFLCQKCGYTSMALMSRLWTGFFGTARCRYPEKFSKPGFQPKMA